MKKILTLLFLSSLVVTVPLSVQGENDSLISREEQTRILTFLKKLQFGLYMDVYATLPLNDLDDSSHIMPLYANSMYSNDFRLNVVGLTLNYRDTKARANLTLQYGDIPMLLTKVEYQWVKYLRQANFGFRVSKQSWIDLGFLLNPIGVESTWPVNNKLSTTSLGGWFEPGSFLGVKFSTRFREKLALAVYLGNPYSVAYNQDTYVSGGFQLSYTPADKLGIYYANLAGFQSRDLEHHSKFQLYNNLIIDYSPLKWLNLTAQYDFAWQTNSHLGADTSKLSYLHSGFLQASVRPVKWFSFTAKGEFFTDPNGFLSGVYDAAGTPEGFRAESLTAGVEFKPLQIIYLRAEYRYVNASQKLYDNQTSERQGAVTLTAGIRIL